MDMINIVTDVEYNGCKGYTYLYSCSKLTFGFPVAIGPSLYCVNWTRGLTTWG